ncbi:uncharacterized protein LOC103314813 [Tribolium castaneum]|uniref:Uncharacterized protein n=1 Tax=Tribolium castaneum TaxID=7070 RepID=A0A139WE25_TRICA|nr:PREDICTED: uncharacterized protein LOC103314813 [Tribolium castaneum]KYB26186.1 hypothetical protein TcasGA2_TC031265 [Tribolium castaneum]|eukprot:XP_008199990.1 PREDICTED: uncharacterized protein LOC103314813 [Tribolium castaneum]
MESEGSEDKLPLLEQLRQRISKALDVEHYPFHKRGKTCFENTPVTSETNPQDTEGDFSEDSKDIIAPILTETDPLAEPTEKSNECRPLILNEEIKLEVDEVPFLDEEAKNFLKKNVKKDHAYARIDIPENSTGYRKLYMLEKQKLSAAKKKLSALNKAFLRQKSRRMMVKKLLREMKRKTYSKISQLLKDSGGSFKNGKPKKILIVI